MEGAGRPVEIGVRCKSTSSKTYISISFPPFFLISFPSAAYRNAAPCIVLFAIVFRINARGTLTGFGILSLLTMALVFKIKHGETLRRWVVSDSINAETLPITLEQLQAKIRELFQFPPSSELVITYIDKENDVVTLGEDRDLVDACLVQHLNPLRLEVQVLESKPNASDKTGAASEPAEDFNMEGFLKFLFPQVTPEVLQRFLQRYTELLDPSLPIATLIINVQNAFKEFLPHTGMPECYKPGPSDKSAHHHPYKHPYGDMRSKSMPNREERTSAKFASSAHLGVQCDSCGECPIQGPRYKSNKIPDYDLCPACYQEKGNEGDYDKIEHPVHDRHYRPPCLRRGFKHFMGPPFMGPPFMGPPMYGRGAFARGPYGWRPERAFGHHHDDHKKLDARFVKDVTIFDGTELAPCTKFTKIWRMSNNGSLPWPQNTQLLHIGGDVLSSQEVVPLELPESGLACGEELEVSVDLMAPEKAGRYISHWRLVSPAGQKFGQRVWVTIQVVPQGEQSPMLEESMKDGEGKGNTETGPSIIVVPVVSGEDTEMHNPPSLENKYEMLVDDAAGSKSCNADAKVTENAPDLSQELEGFSLVEKPVELNDEEMTDHSGREKDEQQLKLQSLESMGFMDHELNVALLNKNSGNVQLTLDDLLIAAGWDGALQDLQEMGFTDQATNVKLLMKHNGNIKAAVKDLVQKRKEKA